MGGVRKCRASVCIASTNDRQRAIEIREKASEEKQPTYESVHADCTFKPSQQAPREKLHVNILRVCREIHAEAALIPFEETVFSIHKSYVLKTFLQQLVPSQARALTSMVIVSGDFRTSMPTKAIVASKLVNMRHLTCFVPFGNQTWPGRTLQNKALRQECNAVLTTFRHASSLEDVVVAAYNSQSKEALIEWPAMTPYWPGSFTAPQPAMAEWAKQMEGEVLSTARFRKTKVRIERPR